MAIMHSTNEDVPAKDKIAYFSMEVGLQSEIATYSGGLGILAGDTLKSFADVGVPSVGITMLNEKGYFYQKIDSEGNQIEEHHDWFPQKYLEHLPNEITIIIEDRVVRIRAWRYIIKGARGYEVPVIYLDTNVEGNSDYDKTLTQFLYSGDRYYRLCQEIVLGIGGIRMLQELGYVNLNKFHMNEGHAALLALELYKKCGEEHCDMEALKKKCVFTTHTPVPAGHDRFDMEIFKRVMNGYMPDFMLNSGTDGDKFNMTLFAMNMSKYVNGVAKRHGEVTRDMFPNFKIDSITNGIHTFTWTTDEFKKLFDEHIPGWTLDPYALRSALQIPEKLIYEAHQKNKRILIEHINEKYGKDFSTEVFTIGFARRFTAYKRPDLILSDVERLKRIAKEKGKIQIVYAGKAHIKDGQGKETIKKIITLAKEISDDDIKIIYLENYDMNLGKLMTSGVDVWLNNPQLPLEASGTSGMKACINGVPQFSTIDGWWVEGHVENVTGWSIGKDSYKHMEESDHITDSDSLYTKLENIIIPKYYNEKEKWMRIMRNCIAFNASFFNTYRMTLQYVTNAYLY